jgi:hypothetical protein
MVLTYVRSSVPSYVSGDANTTANSCDPGVQADQPTAASQGSDSGSLQPSEITPWRVTHLASPCEGLPWGLVW